ncbi:endonuclease/exonuclease/phosphatase family protein [Ancylomarina salipaludis]|uniref:Endonuclease/exonuclease/phosphatase family protein n=1 Tax=Ancylomarina salipaludis TaxID=2501299 RepID=A0A4Q1JLL4_9BACT|nr:endonuclease/exonuclease/phosphatase family protein [Ancylomarina salipaludis]RXQ94987.1 endonuclease/exonuclease/phosphatase family protein [Ancylomarina salipaludis]
MKNFKFKQPGLLVLLACLLLNVNGLSAQKKQKEVSCIAFYNLENLFDTIDDPEKYDEEYTPEGKNKWTETKYNAKLFNMAHVISLIGKEGCKDGFSILGVCEIENRKVLEDLIAQPALVGRNLQIVHYPSPDKRGIDVGLLYNPKRFEVIESKSFRLNTFKNNGDTLFTRDQLLVTGLLDKEKVHVIVNHWPSRSSGEKISRPSRNAASQLSHSICDSLSKADPSAKILVMGDLNDDPFNESVKKYMKTKAKISKMDSEHFYNPWENILAKGIGTLAYRDTWNLFDQILLSNPLVDKNTKGYKFIASKIFKEKFMIQSKGRYKGYPLRTRDNGYSDHLPVYVFLAREK